jgi:polyisoprenoid-binding protein YceI
MEKTSLHTVAPELVGTWDIDRAHSEVGFSVRHAMVATVRGGFNDFAGTITVGEDLTNSSVEVTIDPSTIVTGNPDRDNHLRSADFFDVETYPRIAFKSTRVEPAGEGRFRVVGDLSIRNVTREVELDVEFNGTSVDPYGKVRGGLEATTTISRKDWGLVWNVALEAGGVLVGDKIKITLGVAAVKRAAAVAAA